MRLISATIFILLLSSIGHAASKKHVVGSFEMSGHTYAVIGWQRWSKAPVTDQYAGIFGSTISPLWTPAQVAGFGGDTQFRTYVQDAELTLTKRFGDNVVFSADLWFGRPASGSPFTFLLEHATMTISLMENRLDLIVGRYGLPTGVESYEIFNNDTISESILSNASLYAITSTGAMLRARIIDELTLYFGLGTGYTVNNINRGAIVPTALLIADISWDQNGKSDEIVLTFNVGPESNKNSVMSYGVNADFYFWLTKHVMLSMEGLWHRDDGNGGPTTDYAAALFNLRWNITDDWYAVAKYSFGHQFEAGSGYYNLMGAKQKVHEMSLGAGYALMDGFMIKLEGRVDYVTPDASPDQWVYGMAMGFQVAF